MVWATISWYSVGPIFTLQGHVTANDSVTILGDQVHPMVQTLFPNGDAIYQANNASFVVCFGEQSACALSTSIIDNRTYHVFQEEWYKIPLQIIQDLYLSIPRRLQAVLQAYTILVTVMCFLLGVSIFLSIPCSIWCYEHED
ncbi:hypothetical protein B7P43_G14289 [Cryptotermes secundus]|uniref:Uncharacterized protein n=1 Tax=Cryptotermes secundus TaxID=105785 RepID=A0A2J7QHC0_9NEOP|nr:hypothetical protein B7P43_G14289 [Cryptotermes secundus]